MLKGVTLSIGAGAQEGSLSTCKERDRKTSEDSSVKSSVALRISGKEQTAM